MRRLELSIPAGHWHPFAGKRQPQAEIDLTTRLGPLQALFLCHR